MAGTQVAPQGPAAEPPLRVAPGARIAQYELIRRLGRGGMGVVYAARDMRLGRRVAIKFLLDGTREINERFLVEARATAQCSHDNIVIIHEVDEHAGTPYMVLELLDGQTLREVMAGGQLPPSRVVELALPIARALARAHELGIIHRDLKPENVIITTAGQVKVLDFGIAKAVGAAEPATGAVPVLSPGELGLTREGALLGTLPYMSPEQLGADDVDHRSDVWALGIIIWEMLVGRHPIQPLTTPALVAAGATLEAPMPAVQAARADVPDELAALTDACLHKRKSERLASAAELVAALEKLLPGRRGRPLADGESPYPGLTAFQESDADRFFGRSHDIARMVARVRERALTGVVGPSGVGKSSFVRAGLGPALKASGEAWEIVTLRPGRQPLVALASSAERMKTKSGSNRDRKLEIEDHEALLARLRAEPGYFGAILRARARQGERQILLFVDQFEELYTLVPDREERRAFTAALAAVADDPASPLRVVIAMRSDFLDRLGEDPDMLDELTRGLVFLAPPDRDALREVITLPLEAIGYRFETGEIVDDMIEALAGQPGALPLIQFAASKLWELRDRRARLVTRDSYRVIGGVSGALATHADEVVGKLDAHAQRLVPRLLRALVTPERTRAIVEVEDLHALDPGAERAVDQLVAARLLVIQSRGEAGGGTVELVHESLIDRWPALRAWLDADQESAAYRAQLAVAAKQWDAKGRPSGLLWRGDAMEEARRWFASRPRELAARDRAFLEAVFALARRGQRMRRAALIGAFVVLGTIAAGATTAYVRVRAAEQQATDEATRATTALDQERRAQAERLSAENKRRSAEDKQRAAEAEVQAKSAQVAQSREELQAENAKLAAALAELKAALAETTSARERADAASRAATKAATDATDANTQLKAALDRERERVRQLEEEKKKIATKLR